MADLNTTYLGLKLKNPLVASASPLSESVDSARKLEEAGIAAIVMYSLFEEQVIRESLELDYYLERGTNAWAEATSFYPEVPRYNVGPGVYLEQIKKLKKALNVPVIASLNGVSKGGWLDYAERMEEAGADAIELNLYYLSTDPAVTSQELEDQNVSLVADIRSRINIPVSVKLSPFYTSLPNLAKRLSDAGADGLVLFNRFYQPDFDLEALEVTPHLVLSTSQELQLPLRWIAILYGRIQADFGLTSGVHTVEDVVKATMAGASVSMMASELLQNGIERVTQLLSGLETWMDEHEYESVVQMTGSMSQQSAPEPAAFERANYIKVLSSFDSYSQSMRER